MFSDHFWKMIDRSFGAIFLTSVVALTAFCASIEIKDFDIWLHLAVGRYILEHGYVPFVDVMSNVVFGAWWFNHEWLFQIIVAYLQGIMNYDGLIYMQVVVVIITFLMLIISTFRSRNYVINGVVLLLVMFVYQQRFTVRPDIFSILFLSAYLLVVLKFIKHRWSVYAIFLTQILWVNIHGLSFLGHAVLFIFIVAEFIKRRVPLPYEWNDCGRLCNKGYLNLKLAFIFSLIGSVFNPLFIEGAWSPLYYIFFQQGDSKQFFEYITELQKPFPWHDFFNFNDQRYYKLLIILFSAAVVLCRKKLNLGLLGVGLLMFIFSQVAVRNLIYFAVLAHLVIVYHISHQDWRRWIPVEFVSKKVERCFVLILKVVLIFWVMNYAIDFSGRGYYDFDARKRKSELLGVAKRVFPQKAVEFLVNNNIKGNFWNDFNSGSYLLGHTFPQINVYIDGRTEPYGFKHFEKYLKVWTEGDEATFDQEVNKYNLTGLFINGHYISIPDAILEMIFNKEEWKLVYFDYDAVIFLKDVPENKRWIDQYAFDIKDWQVPQVNTLDYGVAYVNPYHFVKRARMLHAIGEDDKALDELKQALLLDPSSVDAFMLRGTIYKLKDEFLLAYDNFRQAYLLSNGSLKSRQQLAVTLYYMEHYDEANDHFEVLNGYFPNNPFILYWYSRVRVAMDDFERAWILYENAVDLSQDISLKDMLVFAESLKQKGQWLLYEKALLKAYHAYQEEVEPIELLIEFYESQDNEALLNTYLEKGRDIDPDNVKWKKK